MNIAIVTTWFERGAAYVSRQYKDVLKKDFNVYIYARGGEVYAKNNPDWDKKNVTWGPKTSLPVPMAIDLEHLKFWLIKNNIEIIFFNEQQWWPPILLCKSLGIKTGCYIDYYTQETIPFFEMYDFLICNTKRHFSAFEWHPQAFYIPWGTDTALFSPKAYPAEQSTPTFFHSCGYSPFRKGTDFVIEAFAQIHGKKKLIIHSQIDLKVFFPTLKNILCDLESSGQLQIITQTVPAPGLYHLGDVYIYPSRLDGIGLTIAEALSCGLPVITSNNQPMNEFITPENGFLIDLKKLYSRPDGYYWPQCDINITQLREIMQSIIDNKIPIKNMKEQARKSALSSLDWGKNNTQLSSIFKSSRKLSYSKKIELQIVEYEKLRGGIPKKTIFPPIAINMLKKLLYREQKIFFK